MLLVTIITTASTVNPTSISVSDRRAVLLLLMSLLLPLGQCRRQQDCEVRLSNPTAISDQTAADAVQKVDVLSGGSVPVRTG